MNLCVIKSNSQEIISTTDFLNKMNVEIVNLEQDDLNDFDSLCEIFNLPEVSSLNDLFLQLKLDEYLLDTASEIAKWGYWIAENDCYNSINYNSITILKYDNEYTASEKYSGEVNDFVTEEFFRYIVKNKIDDIVGIYACATEY